MDEHYDKVSLLLPMSGVNNGMVFTDVSLVPKTVTRYGDAKTVTSQSKFYGSSGYFDGVGDYLTIPHSSDLDLTSGLFAVSAWVRLPTVTSADTRGILTSRTSTDGFVLRIQTSGKVLFFITGQPTADVESTNVISANTWHHIAISFDGSAYRIFLDGTLEKEVVASVSGAPGVGIMIGASTLTGAGYFNGYIQDLLVIKGAAIYTADFIPPSRLIGQISGAVADVNGDPVARTVFAVLHGNPSKMYGPVTSSGVDGTYTIPNIPAAQATVVALASDAEADYNSLVNKVVPV